MQLEQLKYIITVAKNNSISESAKKLFISQSALSQSISKLEEELGIQIFNRTRLGTFPTPEGKKILTLAETALEQIEQMKNFAHAQKSLIKKELKIGIVKGLHFPFFPLVLSQLKKNYPSLKVTLIEKGSSDLIKAIRNKQVDVGILVSYEKTVEETANFYTEILYEENLYVLFNKNSHLANYEYITPNQILNLSFVHFNGEFMNWFYQRFSEEFGQIEVLFTSKNAEVIREVIKDGLAITIETKLEILNNPYVKTNEILFRPLKQDILTDFNIIIASLDRKLNQSEIKSFIELFKLNSNILKNDIIKL